MHLALAIVALVTVVTFVSQVSRRFLSVPPPLVLTMVGLAASFVPGIPRVELSPELVLIGFLPPLLYAAAIETSLVDFRRNARPIALLSVGLVLATTAVARRVGMPRRMVTILQGESLVNDATALVALRAAIAGIGGTVSQSAVGIDFVVTGLGGVAVGLVVAYATGKLRKHIDDDITETAVSIVTPFISYLSLSSSGSPESSRSSSPGCCSDTSLT